MSDATESVESDAHRRFRRRHTKRGPRSPAQRLLSNGFGSRERFAQNVVCGVPLRDAYVEAGFADAIRADANALRLLRDAEVAARVAWLQQEALRTEASEIAARRARMIARLESMIVADRAGMYDADGALLPLDKLTAEQRALIDSVRPTKSGREALMPSRLAAMQLLAKLEGLEAPEKRDVHVVHERRYTDIELARWIASRLESAGAARPVLELPAEKDGAA